MDNMKKWLVERQAVYSILALLFRGEIKTGLDLLLNTEILEKFAVSNENSELSLGAEEGLIDIKNYNHANKYIELIYEDYQNLFIGPNELLAPPWESVYLSKDKLIFGESELTVRKLYNSFGLDVSSTEPADHIAFELSFMSRLNDIALNNPCDEIAENIEKQQSFLKEHLLRWIPFFTNDIINNSQTKFWRSFARVTKGWLLHDLIEIEKMLDEN